MRRLLLSLVALATSALLGSLQAETYILAVGIADYQNISDLRLPEQDAETIAKLYRTRTRNVVTLTGSAATRENIIKEMTNLFAKAKPDDMVVFFFSGHGYVGGFCPYDTGAKNKNALSYNDVYAIFRQTKALRKVVLADACMSGGMRKKQGAKSSATHKTSDVVMFLSSRTNESSIERPKMKNGFFTTYLNRGLRGGADVNRDSVVTAKEIFNFVSDGVKTMSNDRQHPVMWGNFSDNFIMVDWRKR